MKAGFYLLIGLAALALSACDGEKKQQNGEANPQKLAQYTKHISRKWRIDSLFMKRELKAYWDTTYRVAHRLMPGSENYAVSYLQGAQDSFFSRILYRQEEFFPDGKRLSKDSRYIQIVDRKYAFSNDLDSLFLQNQSGETEERFKLAAISDTSFVVIQDLYLPTEKLENRRFFKARCRYVPSKG